MAYWKDADAARSKYRGKYNKWNNLYRFGVSLEPDDAKQIKQHVKKQGLNIHELTRKLLLEWLRLQAD